MTRRLCLISFGVSSILVAPPSGTQATAPALAATQHDQLEFCLASLIRAVETFRAIAEEIDTSTASKESLHIDSRLNAYLDARAGAKALLTGNIQNGGRITKRVFLLSSLRLPAALNDLKFYASSTPSASMLVSQEIQDLTEALASIVEFDGLDSLTDPSPRLGLTMAQYTDQKVRFISRCIRERVIPLGDRIVERFDAPAVDAARQYVLTSGMS